MRWDPALLYQGREAMKTDKELKAQKKSGNGKNRKDGKNGEDRKSW
jgi:hypothetical protein